MYSEGQGATILYDKSLGLYKQTCDLGKDIGCKNFKILYDKLCITDPKKYCSKYE